VVWAFLALGVVVAVLLVNVTTEGVQHHFSLLDRYEDFAHLHLPQFAGAKIIVVSLMSENHAFNFFSS
jgi:hypothetical protein